MLRQRVEISANTSGHVAKQEPAERQELPWELEQALGEEDSELFREVQESRLNLTDEDRTHLDILRQQLEAEEITQKGFQVRMLMFCYSCTSRSTVLTPIACIS